MQKKVLLKGIAVYLALSILFQIVSPTVALALTNGPSQPEMESFEPVGTTEMVDPFSGDFNYNIPLMTVPGPNGGYPINLAYHAGIGMEQEASWVGLGWNINPGVISREMRGIPDDFNQDVIRKEMNVKPNRTLGIGLGFLPEFWSFDFNKLGGNFTGGGGLGSVMFNNYKGIGVTFNSGINYKHMAGTKNFGASLNLKFNSFGASELDAGLSFEKLKKDKSKSMFTLGANVKRTSLEGLKSANFSIVIPRKAATPNADPKKRNTQLRGGPAGASFSSSSFIPHANMPNTGFNIDLHLKLGGDGAGIFQNVPIDVHYSESKLKNRMINFYGYGYLYSSGRRGELNDDERQKYAIMDFNREKDVDLCKDIPSMPVPVFTNDIFVIKGQGTGGVFRPYRSDIGIMHDPAIRSRTAGGEAGFEFGPGVPMHLGVNGANTVTQSYSGPWHDSDMWIDLIDNYQFTEKTFTKPLFEASYFREAGDKAVNFDAESGRIGGGKYPLTTEFGLGDFLFPKTDFHVTMNSVLAYNQKNNRQARSQDMQYKTIAQMNDITGYLDAWSSNVYSDNQYPRNGTASYPSRIGGGSGSAHIGEMSVINPDGNKYIYSIPAFNNSQEEVSFSIRTGPNHPIAVTSTIDAAKKRVLYSTTPANDASLDNECNDDNFYMSTKLPEYGHSFLLTGIISPDYIDLTGDGMTDDDYGYWVKFNYTLANSDYHWRIPYYGANYGEGFADSYADDKAGFVYGQKEVWYLTSVETKTHVAEFVLNDNSADPRKDGYGAASRDVNDVAPTYSPTQKLRKLNKINLYSKSDNYYGNPSPKPIKTTHFEYSYDLCANAENNQNYSATGTILPSSDSGKLTLKKVWFTYGNNNKGVLSPYIFDYKEKSPDGLSYDLANNPLYDVLQMDRWGNYKPQFASADGEGSCVDNPYVIQKKEIGGTNVTSLRNKWASAWCLKAITLPSGGNIEIDYESDDYGFVENKTAMQMCRIVGFSEDTQLHDAAEDRKINRKSLYAFFELKDEDAIINPSDVLPYISGISQVYFKVMTRLKKDLLFGQYAYDYVDGYAEIEAGQCGFTTYGLKKYGWVKFKNVQIQDVETGATHTHPITKAGWQYLKLNRPDLLFPASNNNTGSGAAVIQLANIVGSFIPDNLGLLVGYYNTCALRGYCSEVEIDPSGVNYKPSFLRLNVPDGIKFGGGHRVKKLTISDDWEGSVDISRYGQEYYYALQTGASSGVAQYEPLVGGEEIPHHKPIRYSSPYFILKHDDLYLEEPIGESYYPSPNVGYSRVTVLPLFPYDNHPHETAQGNTMYEFYTAKDFPISVVPQSLTHKKFTPKITIPFIGSHSFDDHGFSQRFYVETNDMHGKLKAVSTYNINANIFTGTLQPQPVTQTKYIYSTDNTYSPSTVNHLNNNVDVLFADAYYKQAEMGVTREFFIDMREESDVTTKMGGAYNLEFQLPAVYINVFIPTIEYSEALFKSIVAMDVVAKNGILMETVTSNEGGTITSKNLMFDAATGDPLLTTVTNDFDKPVYNYNYSAHWAYDGMGASYKNTGAYFDYSAVVPSGNVITITNASSYFMVGDEVGIFGSSQPIFYVTAVTSGTITLVDRDGFGPPTGAAGMSMSILRSARRNQQSISNGNIVSLSNPVSDRQFPLFDEWNEFVDADIIIPIKQIPPSSTILAFNDCAVPTLSINATVSYPSANVIQFLTEGCGLETNKIIFPSSVAAFSSSFYLKKAGTKVYATDVTTGNVLIGDWVVDLKGTCLKECLPDVLHASSMRYKDNWTDELASVVTDINNNNVSGTTAPTSTQITNSPWLYGGTGIWRNWQSYAFQIDRNQTTPGTDISKDGTYKNFVLFDWGNGLLNPQWTKAMEVTKYSPYGFELENKDALNIYSSAVYGYNNSLVTAVAANSSYFETAYDGFEDYYSYATGITAYALNKGHGHLNLSYSGSAIGTNFSDISHTGKYSVTLPVSSNITFSSVANFFNPELIDPLTPALGNKAKKYLVSAWFNSIDGTPQISVTGPATVVSSKVSEKIEGWRKVDVVFETTSGGTSAVNFSFGLSGASYMSYLDDIRIIPFQGTIKSYVYDNRTLWLIAELDNQNFATFYNYDEEGTLVQVKKETVKGIMTLKTTRSNIRQ